MNTSTNPIRPAPLLLAAYVLPCDGDDELIAAFRDSVPVSSGEAEELRSALAILRATGRIALPLPGLRLLGLDGVAVVVATPDGITGLGVVPRGQEPLTPAQVHARGWAPFASLPPPGLRLVYVPLSSVREALQ